MSKWYSCTLILFSTPVSTLLQGSGTLPEKWKKYNCGASTIWKYVTVAITVISTYVTERT